MAENVNGILRIATLLIAMSAAPVALAVATLDITFDASTRRADQPREEVTSIALFDSSGANVRTLDEDSYREDYDLPAGTYRVDVRVGGFFGRTVSSTITLTDGPNRLRLDLGTYKLEPVTPDAKSPAATVQPFTFPPYPTFALGGAVGTGQVRLHSQPSIGTNTATDTPFLQGSGRISTTAWDVPIQLPQGIRVSFGGVDGHRTTSAQSPGVGWLYDGFDRPTTGLDNGPLPVTGSLETRITEFDVDVGLPSRLLKKDGKLRVYGDPMVRYEGSKITWTGMLMNNVVPNVFSTTDQQVKENDLSIGYGLRGRYMTTDQFWTSGGIGASIGGFRATYHGSQHNVCSVCSPATQDFTETNSDSKSGATWGAWVNAALGYAPSANVDLWIQAEYRYDGRTATLVNKTTPADPTSHLAVTSREFANVQVGVAVKF